MLPTQIYKML